ncbi:tetratricopeptide repeat protein [uncultured Abyssibacter sp.]|uniref:tetratricopeptide repeat protein n=1 Tax=uncultured Abyssibacter sp. TaxID=2320202 RepID=UPI0032B243C5
MSFRSIRFARRASCLALAAAMLAGCATSPTPSQPQETAQAPIALPPVPEIEIPDAAFNDFAAAINALKRGNEAAAESALRTMIRNYPQIAGPYSNLAGLLAQRGENEEALELIRQAVERNPRSAPAYNLQGLLERRAGNFEASELAYRKALSADATFTDAQRNLGILYDLYLRKPEKALAAYRAYQEMLAEPDDTVGIWIADLERRTQ